MNLNKLEFFSVAEAKSKFSKVIEESKKNNIIITKNGKPEVVMIDYMKFVRMIEFLDEVKDLTMLEIEDINRYKEIKEFFETFDNL